MDARKVIVGLSGDVTQKNVIKKAVNIVKSQPNATLVFVHAVEPPLFDYLDFKHVVNPENIKNKLLKEIATYETNAKIVVSVEFGNITDILLNEVRKYEADLIVIGANSSGKLEDIGSNATKILNAAVAPVLLVKTPDEYETKFLTLFDLTGIRCVPKNLIRDKFLKDYAKSYLYVYSVPDELSMRFNDIEVHEFEHWEKKVRKIVAEKKAEFESEHQGIELVTHETKGSVASGVNEYVKENCYRLIAIDSTNIQGSSSIIFGSVASNVAKDVNADLLIGFCED